MQRNRNSLQQRRFAEREIVPQAMDNARGHNDKFRKSAIAAVVTAGNPEYLPPIAQVYVPAPAVAALAAIHSGIKSDAVAFGKAICARAGFGNCPGGFVTHH